MGKLSVVVVPRATKSEVVGWHGDAVRIRVAAPPANGAANTELVRFLAERLGVPRSAVRVVHGTASRRKAVEVQSLEPPAILSRLGLAATPRGGTPP